MAQYLICLDFEATCYPSKHQRNKGWYHEIVGFGAVLMRLYNGEIESEFESNVKPTEFYLTQGCKKKLGVCQHVLEDCSTLPSVLASFCKWIKEIRNEYDLVMPRYGRSDNENTYYCTWSNMDLNYFLPNECKKKSIGYANHLKYWINGQEIFNDIYGRNAKLHEAADYLDTYIVGDAHNALDDAKTLAYLVHDMWDKEDFKFNVKNCR